MKKLIATAVLAISLSGCAASLMQPVAMTSVDRAQFEASGDVTVSMQQTPGFLFNTPASAVVNAGLYSWKDASDAPSWGKLKSAHGIGDFTETVRDKLTAKLASDAAGINFTEATERQPYSTKEETAYVQQFPTDYVLEVRSQFGSFHYGPLSWKTYFLNYSGQARLIRTADQAVVWKESCQVKGKDEEVLQVPYEDFTEGNGDKLNAAVAFATDSCASQLAASYDNAL